MGTGSYCCIEKPQEVFFAKLLFCRFEGLSSEPTQAAPVDFFKFFLSSSVRPGRGRRRGHLCEEPLLLAAQDQKAARHVLKARPEVVAEPQGNGSLGNASPRLSRAAGWRKGDFHQVREELRRQEKLGMLPAVDLVENRARRRVGYSEHRVEVLK